MVHSEVVCRDSVRPSHVTVGSFTSVLSTDHSRYFEFNGVLPYEGSSSSTTPTHQSLRPVTAEGDLQSR